MEKFPETITGGGAGIREPTAWKEGKLMLESILPTEPINVNLSLTLNKPQWRNIYTIPQGTVLLKGRTGLYSELIEAAGNVKNSFGCYSWGSENIIYYCGSFSKDYTQRYLTSNFHGRIHNYLQNHREKENGRKNTNLMAFENINASLKTGKIVLRHLIFETVRFCGNTFTFESYSSDRDIVLAIEELLIRSYKRLGQCEWNRS